MSTFLTSLARAALRLAVIACAAPAVHADASDLCSSLPSHSALKSALAQARSAANGGFNTEMWGTIVNRNGIVCAVASTGAAPGDQWPGSRLISAEKAYTANAFSLPKLAVSTANLYTATQPGGPLFGLAEGNPLDVSTAYNGVAARFGTSDDPLVGNRVGGTITFGGGVPLYDSAHEIVGALGVSGDSACADHNIAWRTRNILELDFVPAGINKDTSRGDNIIFDIIGGRSASGWGHASCGAGVAKIANALPVTRK